MKKFIAFIIAALFAAGVWAEVSVTSIKAQPQHPWNWKVDIEVQLSGAADELAGCEIVFAATNATTKAELTTAQIEKVGEDEGSGESWTRHYVWDAKADIGAVKINELELTVAVIKELGGIQLWEGGPFFAECNVGATKPEEYGYYFWWGDTVGFTRSGGTWNGDNYEEVTWESSSGTFMSSSPFLSSSNCPTYEKSYSQLQSTGYIDATGNLIAAHDAATSHLGAPWRMPTNAEFEALLNNCNTTWTTRNGFYGRLITGRGAFSSSSIFLPAAGYGLGSDLWSSGYCGYYWSSTRSKGTDDYSGGVWFLRAYFENTDLDESNRNYRGRSVRPVRGASDVGTICANSVSMSFAYVPALPDGGPYKETVDGVEYTFTISNGEATIGSGSSSTAIPESTAGALIVPSILGGCPVIEIDGWSFRECNSLTSVTIPKSVTTIGRMAFYRCSSLKSVVLPESVKIIESEAFQNCSSLDEVTILAKNLQFGSAAFGGTPWYESKIMGLVLNGGAENTVVVTNVVVHYVLNSVQPEFVKPVSEDTGFVNVIAEVKGNNVAVPQTWAENYPGFAAKFGKDFTKALTAKTGKIAAGGREMLVWEDYVAGTDPTDPNDRFTASMTMVDGKPVISYTPELDDARAALRKYTTYGKVKLTDLEWSVIPEGKESDYNFFKVTVEMK